MLQTVPFCDGTQIQMLFESSDVENIGATVITQDSKTKMTMASSNGSKNPSRTCQSYYPALGEKSIGNCHARNLEPNALPGNLRFRSGKT